MGEVMGEVMGEAVFLVMSSRVKGKGKIFKHLFEIFLTKGG
jgi:hypothetical protein